MFSTKPALKASFAAGFVFAHSVNYIAARQNATTGRNTQINTAFMIWDADTAAILLVFRDNREDNSDKSRSHAPLTEIAFIWKSYKQELVS